MVTARDRWRLHFANNTEWRIAQGIVNGFTARGCAPPPERVRRLYDDIKGVFGASPERQPDGQLARPRGVSISNDCKLFRATVIRVEDMSHPLPALEPPGAPWDKRAGPLKSDPVPQVR